MNQRWRSFSLIVLAILLVAGIHRVSVDNEDRRQEQAAQEAVDPSANQVIPSSQKPETDAQIVPLYPWGELFAGKETEEITDINPVQEPGPQEDPTSEKQIDAEAQPVQPNVPSPPLSASNPLEGDHPVLDVGYGGIGFERYLDVIERVGRLFLLVQTEKGLRLGPEVTLKRRHLYEREANMSILAVHRPHLVTDERIRERLTTMNIPTNARTDSVVLILTKPFDGLLWDTITETLDQRKMKLQEVSEIAGTYIEGPNGVFLKLESVLVKANGNRIGLDRKLRVSL